MRTRKIVRNKTKVVRNKTTEVKLVARGAKVINQRVTILNVKQQTDRTQPKMLGWGFNPYQTKIQIPSQAPHALQGNQAPYVSQAITQPMISTIVNRDVAIERISQEVQTEISNAAFYQSSMKTNPVFDDTAMNTGIGTPVPPDASLQFGSPIGSLVHQSPASGSKNQVSPDLNKLRLAMNSFNTKYSSASESDKSKTELLAIATNYQGKNKDEDLKELLNKTAKPHHYSKIQKYLEDKL